MLKSKSRQRWPQSVFQHIVNEINMSRLLFKMLAKVIASIHCLTHNFKLWGNYMSPPAPPTSPLDLWKVSITDVSHLVAPDTTTDDFFRDLFFSLFENFVSLFTVLGTSTV